MALKIEKACEVVNNQCYSILDNLPNDSEALLKYLLLTEAIQNVPISQVHRLTVRIDAYQFC